MKETQNLLRFFEKLNKNDSFFPAVVKSVEDDNTCTILVDEIEYFDVRLQSIANGVNGTVVKPTLDSLVLVQRIGKDDDFAVIMYSQIDEVKTVIGTNTLTHNLEGFEVKGGADTLGKIIGELLTGITQITCNVTAVGAPTGLPINLAVFQALKTRLDLFIK